MKQIEAEVTTTNKSLGGNPDDPSTHVEIAVTVQVEVPESFDEAIEFYGSEEKALVAIQEDVKRRKVNAARPVLRDAVQELDWEAVAQQAVNDYTPGRRGGFGVQISRDEVEEKATTGSVEDLLAYLASKGAKIS